ncbi:MAG: transporter [Sphingobacteriales bacterium 41-5]|nr:MAG: transporter [Sphingobacteriales bacterium 41-5]
MGSFAQERPTAESWTLQQCVEYAIKNNISVKQADVQARIDKLTLEQSNLALYPNASFQSNQGFRLGRSIDPTQNQFTTSSMFFSNPNLNLDAELFNWFRKKNTIATNKLLAEAGGAKLEKARNDIALNVANAYLAALLNKEQINVAQVQLNQTREQLTNIEKQVNAGALPELNLAEMQTQLANDSATLIGSRANYTLSLLQLKAVLNLDAAEPFGIATPPVEDIPVEPLSELDPASVYASALENLPQQKINTLNVQAAETNVKVARASMYPTFYAFGGLGSNYSSLQKVIPTSYEQKILQIGSVTINGTTHPVLSAWPQDIPVGTKKGSYFNQIANNFGQNIGVGLTVPIFNAGMARTNWKKAQLNVESQQLLKEQDSRTLKQDIYQAHTNAVAALEKFNAASIALESAQKAYDFAKRRFEVGLLQPIDLIINQNNLSRSKINMISAQYDYVFKMKLLEFYKGKGLKL